MPFETVTPVLPAGAGRFQDWIWPDTFTHDAAINAALRARNSQGDSSVGGGESVGVAGGNTVVSDVLNGVFVGRFNCNGVGASTIFRFPKAGFFHVKTTRNNIAPLTDDTSAKRLITNMALLNVPNGNMDFGVEYVQRGGGSRIIADGDPGWGILLVDLVTARFIVSGPNGVITEDFAVDTTVLHAYEFRITDATATVEAQLQLLIDGQVQALSAASSAWGPGTNLPPEVIISSVGGWQCCLCPSAGNVNALFVQQQRMIMAPSLLMTF